MISNLDETFALLRRRRWVMTAVVSTGVLIVLVWWVLLPRLSSAYRSFQDWQRQRERIQSAAEWESQLARLEDEKQRLQRRLDSLFVSLPEGDRMSVVLDVVQKHAERGGIELRQVRPRAKVTFDTYEELPLDVVLTGRYHSIARFVDRIEQSQYLMKVDEVALRSEDMLSDTLQVQIRLNLVTLRTQETLSSEREFPDVSATVAEGGIEISSASRVRLAGAFSPIPVRGTDKRGTTLRY